MNNQMIAQNGLAVSAFSMVPTMSSREIADLAGARHNDVIVTIDRLFDKRLLRSSRESRIEPTGGRPIEVYDLIERDVYIVIAGYSDEVRARIIDRWQELEQGSAPAVPQSFAEALRLAATQAENIERLAIERDQAIATKAQIGNKREATAMATAANARRETAKLRDELGRNRRHATVIAVERATGLKFPKNAYVALRKWCKKNDAAAVDVVDERYGTVKAWPAGAWLAEFDIDLGGLFDGGLIK